ncbi:class E sortase [Candidatus Saccharibacteria bacterium]|nr:class E sortase [Candidatus Saccharibacteria bacterium]
MVTLLAVYIAAAPFLPQVGWWVTHESPVKGILPNRSNAAATPEAEQVIEGDKLFIPRIDLAEPIHGGGAESLNLGVWRVPHTSTPDRGGNTVLVGHRFTYRDPTGVFYHLDKVKEGDEITVHWQGKAYEYEVTEIKVVPATEVSVEHNTTTPRLTIYTCTPLWSVENRLVVIAEPKGANR